MSIDNKTIKEETLSLLTAPTFLVYVAGLIIAFFSLYLPGLSALGQSQQVLETGDSIGFASARFFAGQLGTIVLFLPGIATALSCVRDREKQRRELEILRNGLNPTEAVIQRFVTQAVLMFIPILLLATYEAVAFAGKPGSIHFLSLSFAWLLPALLLEIAFSLAFTEWTGNCLPAIAFSLILWVFTQGSTGDVGDYNSCIAIRHQIIGGFAEYKAGIAALCINRAVILLLTAGFVVAAVYGCKFRRGKNPVEK